MEPQSRQDVRSTVDTSRAFSSVKEAVAIFGERLLLGELHSPHKHFAENPIKLETSSVLKLAAPSPVKEYNGDHDQENSSTVSWRSSPSHEQLIKPPARQNKEERALYDTVRKLEAELEETKEELKLLKQRGSETEITLATLNAELHKNMSKLAKAEAVAAATKAASFERVNIREANVDKEEKKKKDVMIRMDDAQTLAQILSIGDTAESYLITGRRERKMRKKKPIIPLVGDLFSKKKGSATDHHPSPLYSSPYFCT